MTRKAFFLAALTTIASLGALVPAQAQQSASPSSQGGSSLTPPTAPAAPNDANRAPGLATGRSTSGGAPGQYEYTPPHTLQDDTSNNSSSSSR